jgi:cell wall-associated NlpC family hydrolase
VPRRLPLVGLLCAAVALAGCTSQPRREIRGDATAASQDVVFRALGLVGTPYRYGGNTPEGGFDCSGLVGFVFGDSAGLALPRTVEDLSGFGRSERDRARLASADIVVFSEQPHGGEPSHVGIYVGDGRFVHAPKSGGTVRLDDLSEPYWRERFLGGRRVL